MRFAGLDILGKGLHFGPRRQGARLRRAGGARRHQGKGETESTKPFSRDFIVSAIVVVTIAAGVGVVYEVLRTPEERAREAEVAASQRRRRDLCSTTITSAPALTRPFCYREGVVASQVCYQ